MTNQTPAPRRIKTTRYEIYIRATGNALDVYIREHNKKGAPMITIALTTPKPTLLRTETTCTQCHITLHTTQTEKGDREGIQQHVTTALVHLENSHLSKFKIPRRKK